MTGLLASMLLLLAIACTSLLVPMLRPGTRSTSRHDLLAASHAAQRRELDDDLEAGIVSASDHLRMADELQRRLQAEQADGAVPERSTGHRLAPAIASVAVVAVALGLYAMLGSPEAVLGTARPAPADATPHALGDAEVAQMVDRLAQRLKDRPDDAQGWAILARSYAALQRFDDSSAAYARAVALAPDDGSLLADYADVLAAARGGDLSGEPERLVRRAVQIDPVSPKALSLLGTIEFNGGDYAAAVRDWQRLRDMLTDESDRKTVDASIAEAQRLGGGAARGSAAGSPVGAPDAAKPVPPASPAPPAAASTARVDGSIALSPTLRERVRSGDVLFIFARAVDGPRMPLAIVRQPATAFPVQFVLDDSQAMAAGMTLSSVQRVVIGARISHSGNALPQSGDLVGNSAPVPVGASGVVITIDAVAP